MSMEIEESDVAERGGNEGRLLVATVHHNLKSAAGTSEIMMRDMLAVLSTFDNHLPSKNRRNLGGLPRKSVHLETNLDSNSSNPILFHGSRKEANEYLRAVDGLRHLMLNMIGTHRSSSELLGVQRLIEISMARLKKEFRRILSANVEPTMAQTDDNSSHGSSDNGSIDEDGSGGGSRHNRNSNADEICEIDMMPLDAVLDLRSIANCMVANGYGGECVQIYRLTRKSVIEGCLKRIGIDSLSKRDVQKIEEGILDNNIRKWIHGVRIAVRILFASEKRLCDEIFAGSTYIRDSCFSEVVNGQMTKILGFGESVAMRKRSSEKLFSMLDMYETLSDLMPDIDTVFSQESCATVTKQASTILVRLRESALGNLTEFENAIHAEKSKAPIPGGTIHPLTRYVMNYLSFLSDYKETLIKITADAPIDIPNALPADLMRFYGDLDGYDAELSSPASALSVRMGWIIIILQCKLDLKSSLYKDVALSYLFLMNNLHYIVKKVKGSEFLGIFGYGWLRKNQDKMKQYAANYERAAWIKVLNCLRDEEGIHVNGDISSGVSQKALDDRFEGFNSAIEETLRKHSGWMVPDVQLQEELRISIAKKMIPAYQSFSGRFKSYFQSVGDSEMCMKYSPEDLEALLAYMFLDDSSSRSSRKPWKDFHYTVR